MAVRMIEKMDMCLCLFCFSYLIIKMKTAHRDLMSNRYVQFYCKKYTLRNVFAKA